jgi:hypothetical protein
MANENETGTGTPAGQTAGGGDTNQTQTQHPSAGGQTAVAGAGGTGSQFTYKEDRSDWVPRHRINELSERNRQYEARLKAIEEGQTSRNAEIARALGVNVPSEEEREAEELRKTLYKLVPGLENLEKLDLSKLEQIEAAAAGASETTVRHWERHAEATFNELEAEVASALGLEELTPSQVKKLRRAYQEEARVAAMQRQAAEERGLPADPKNFLTRHERGDKTLIKEFAKEWLNDWAEPARRQSAAQVARRNRPVPGGERTRTMATSKLPEVDYNDEDAFKKALVDARNSR